MNQELIVEVPAGGVASCQLQLVPPRAHPGPQPNWTLLDERGQPVAADAIRFAFSRDSNRYEKLRERALLLVTLASAGGPQDDRFGFFGGGLAYADGHEDLNDDVKTEITKDGQTLVFTIQSVGDSDAVLDFGFLVSRKNRQTGELHLVEGPDPKVIIGRPRN